MSSNGNFTEHHELLTFWHIWHTLCSCIWQVDIYAENWDYLELFDGQNDQATQVAKLSGNLGSFGISSIGNSLFVIFESSYYINYAGFFARIQYGNPHLHIKQYFKTCLSWSDAFLKTFGNIRK